MKAAFAPHDFTQQQVRALGQSVLVTDMQFEERRTASGIVLTNDNGTSRGIRPRWAQVYAVGPEQHHVKAGDWILVAHGRWTRGVDIEDETGRKTMRKIDPDDILLQSDHAVQDETFSDAIHVDAAPAHMQHT